MSAHDDDMITPRNDGAEETLEPRWTTAGHLDDGTIEAWLDAAFDTTQMAEVAAHVNGCATCQARVAHARGFIAGASRVVRALDTVPVGVVSHEDTVRAASRIIAAADATRTDSAVPRVRAQRAWYTQPFVRAAAALLVTVAGGSIVMSRTGRVVVTPAVEMKADRESVAATRVSESVPRVAAAQPTAMPADKMVAARSAPLIAGDTFRKTERVRADGEQRRDATVAARLADAAAAAPAVALPSAVAAPVAPVPTPATIAPMKSAATGSAVTEQLERRENAIEADRLIVGRVRATSGAPVAGAQIAARGATTVVTATDADGRFRLRVRDDSLELSARQLGFDRSTVAVRSAARDSVTVDLTLKSRALALEAVTVAGGRAADEPVASHCWTVQGTPARSNLRLPTELRLPDIDDARTYPVQWMGWPDSNTSLPVRMRVDSNGRLSGESTSEGQQLQLIVQRVASGWQGTATHTIEGKRTIQRVQLKSVTDAVCNP